MITNFNWQYSSIASYTHMVPDGRLFPQSPIASSRFSMLEKVVDKPHPVTYKTVTSNTNSCAYKTMALHLCEMAYYYTFLYFRKGPNKAMIPQCTPVKIGRHHDYRIGATLHVINTGISDFWIQEMKIVRE